MRTLLLALLTMLAGCGDLLSVHPLAAKGVMDGTLTGEWICAEKDCKGSVLVRPEEGYYDIIWIPGEADGEPLRLQGRMVKIGTRMVLDLVTAKRADLAIPGHFFMLLEKSGAGVKFHWLDSDWLRKQAAGPDGVPHLMVDNKPILTGGGAGLQAFLLKFGLDPKATAGSMAFRRVKE